MFFSLTKPVYSILDFSIILIAIKILEVLMRKYKVQLLRAFERYLLSL